MRFLLPVILTALAGLLASVLVPVEGQLEYRFNFTAEVNTLYVPHIYDLALAGGHATYPGNPFQGNFRGEALVKPLIGTEPATNSRNPWGAQGIVTAGTMNTTYLSVDVGGNIPNPPPYPGEEERYTADIQPGHMYIPHMYQYYIYNPGQSLAPIRANYVYSWATTGANFTSETLIVRGQFYVRDPSTTTTTIYTKYYVSPGTSSRVELEGISKNMVYIWMGVYNPDTDSFTSAVTSWSTHRSILSYGSRGELAVSLYHGPATWYVTYLSSSGQVTTGDTGIDLSYKYIYFKKKTDPNYWPPFINTIFGQPSSLDQALLPLGYLSYVISMYNYTVDGTAMRMILYNRTIPAYAPYGVFFEPTLRNGTTIIDPIWGNTFTESDGAAIRIRDDASWLWDVETGGTGPAVFYVPAGWSLYIYDGNGDLVFQYWGGPYLRRVTVDYTGPATVVYRRASDPVKAQLLKSPSGTPLAWTGEWEVEIPQNSTAIPHTRDVVIYPETTMYVTLRSFDLPIGEPLYIYSERSIIGDGVPGKTYKYTSPIISSAYGSLYYFSVEIGNNGISEWTIGRIGNGTHVVKYTYSHPNKNYRFHSIEMWGYMFPNIAFGFMNLRDIGDLYAIFYIDTFTAPNVNITGICVLCVWYDPTTTNLTIKIGLNKYMFGSNKFIFSPDMYNGTFWLLDIKLGILVPVLIGGGFDKRYLIVPTERISITIVRDSGRTGLWVPGGYAYTVVGPVNVSGVARDLTFIPLQPGRYRVVLWPVAAVDGSPLDGGGSYAALFFPLPGPLVPVGWGKWLNVTFGFNGSLYLYVNGTGTSGTSTAPLHAPNLPASEPLNVGLSDMDGQFFGFIGRVAVWKGARDVANAWAIWDASFYNGTHILDLSPNGRHLRLVNGTVLPTDSPHIWKITRDATPGWSPPPPAVAIPPYTYYEVSYGTTRETGYTAGTPTYVTVPPGENVTVRLVPLGHYIPSVHDFIFHREKSARFTIDTTQNNEIYSAIIYKNYDFGITGKYTTVVLTFSPFPSVESFQSITYVRGDGTSFRIGISFRITIPPSSIIHTTLLKELYLTNKIEDVYNIKGFTLELYEGLKHWSTYNVSLPNGFYMGLASANMSSNPPGYGPRYIFIDTYDFQESSVRYRDGIMYTIINGKIYRFSIFASFFNGTHFIDPLFGKVYQSVRNGTVYPSLFPAVRFVPWIFTGPVPGFRLHVPPGGTFDASSLRLVWNASRVGGQATYVDLAAPISGIHVMYVYPNLTFPPIEVGCLRGFNGSLVVPDLLYVYDVAERVFFWSCPRVVDFGVDAYVRYAYVYGGETVDVNLTARNVAWGGRFFAVTGNGTSATTYCWELAYGYPYGSAAYAFGVQADEKTLVVLRDQSGRQAWASIVPRTDGNVRTYNVKLPAVGVPYLLESYDLDTCTLVKGIELTGDPAESVLLYVPRYDIITVGINMPDPPPIVPAPPINVAPNPSIFTNPIMPGIFAFAVFVVYSAVRRDMAMGSIMGGLVMVMLWPLVGVPWYMAAGLAMIALGALLKVRPSYE